MTCILNDEKSIQEVSDLGAMLAPTRNDYEQAQDVYDTIATAILSANYGYSLDFKRDGTESELFKQLKERFERSNVPQSEITALVVKEMAYMFSSDFAKKHGNWLTDTETSYEPSIDQLDPSDLDELKQRYSDSIDAAHMINEYNKRLAIHHIMTDPRMLANGIQKDCEAHLQKFMEDSGDLQIEYEMQKYEHDHPDASAQDIQHERDRVTMFIKSEERLNYYESKIQDLMTDTRKKLAKYFKVKVDENGYVDESNINQHKHTKQYIIAKFINNFENRLGSNQDPLAYLQHAESLTNIFLQVLQGNRMSEEDLINTVITEYMNVYKYSKEFIQDLRDLKIDIKNKSAVEQVVFNITKSVVKNKKYALNGKNIIHRIGLRIYDWIKNFFYYVPEKISGSYIGKHSERRIFDSIYKSLLQSAACCDNIKTILDVDYITAACWSTKDRLSASLIAIRENTIRRIKSLESLTNRQFGSDVQLLQLRTLENYLDKAIVSDVSHRNDDAQQALSYFLNDCFMQLSTQRAYLHECESKSEDQLDLKYLMYIKTDVIGAYDKLINYVLGKNMSNLSIMTDLSDENDPESNMASFLIKHIGPALNKVQVQFNTQLDRALSYQIDQYIQETAGRVIKQEYIEQFKRNAKDWLNNDINHGDLSMLDSKILPAKDAESPIIRIIHNRLSEIEQQVESEASAVAAKLERVRIKNRKFFTERLSMFNYLKKYAERDSHGRFTGNFISDVNYGQYITDKREYEEKLKKQMKLPENTQDWTDEQYKEYHTKIFQWEGGMIDGKVKVHRRYKMQYYIDRLNTLTRPALEQIIQLNAKLQILNSKCMRQVVYTDSKGVQKTVNIPMIQDLTPDEQIEYKETVKTKLLLGSHYDVKIDWATGVIEDIIEKEQQYKDIADSISDWNEKKRSYYTPKEDIIERNKQIDSEVIRRKTQIANEQDPILKQQLQNELDDYIQSVYQEQYPMYYAALKELDKDIQTIQNQINDTSDQDRKNTLQLMLNQAKAKKDAFIKHNTRRMINPVLFAQLKQEEDYIQNDEYFTFKHEQDFLRIIKQYIQSNNEFRSRDLSKLSTKALIQLTKIEHNISMLEQDVSTEQVNKPGIQFESMFQVRHVRALNADESVSTISYLAKYKQKLRDAGYSESEINQIVLYKDAAGVSKELSIFSETSPLREAVRYLPAYQRSSEYLYITTPTGMFSELESSMIDEEFVADAGDYYQIDKNTYDNSKKYNEIKDDPVYKEFLDVMNKAWANYGNLRRGWKYKMPQREISTSDMFFRRGFKDRFKYAWNNIQHFNTRDADVNDVILERPDGTVVDTIPIRWTNKLDRSYAIDLDLVSSVIDFYTESLKYKLRTKTAPLMDALHYKLTGGGSQASDKSSSTQAQLAEVEISRGIYGRETRGGGINGRISENEQFAAIASKKLRKVLHRRLMAHNWLSVLANSWDSFCNIIQHIATGKYITGSSLLRSFVRISGQCFHALSSLGRSRAVGLTQGLMQLNGVSKDIHERYEDQHKAWLRRMLASSKSLEFEPIDYTYKALITESVYDAYRLVWNPKTGVYEYLNEEECELVYESIGGTRRQGWNVWRDAKNYSLRKAYKMQNGIATMVSTVQTRDKLGKTIKLNTIDVIRPKTNIGSIEEYDENGIYIGQRSNILETKIRNTIKQISSTVNGMLENEDKNALARHYAGAMVVSFRGWMISQAGEFYKNGSDFLTYEEEKNPFSQIKEFIMRGGKRERLRQFIKQPVLGNRDFEGQYNFSTGTIDKGLHKSLLKIIMRNFRMFLQCLVCPLEWTSRRKHHWHEKGKSMHDIYAIRNICSALDMMLLTSYLGVLAYATYFGDGDDEKDEDELGTRFKSLFYAFAVKSISERFSQLGRIGFLSNLLDFTNSITVATTLIDNVGYVVNLLGDFISMAQHNINPDDEVVQEEWDNIFQELRQGSFDGHTKLDRDITMSLAMVNTDFLPILLALDLGTSEIAFDTYKNLGMKDEVISNIKDNYGNVNFTDYDLNTMKNLSTSANENRAKWYGKFTINNIVDQAWRKADKPILRKNVERTSKSKSNNKGFDTFKFDNTSFDSYKFDNYSF